MMYTHYSFKSYLVSMFSLVLKYRKYNMPDQYASSIGRSCSI